jgi:monofunctional biosynthetic peptidoglycan transglycosylase
LKKVKNIFKNIFNWCLKAALIFLISSVLITIIYRWVPVFVTPLMFIRIFEQLVDGKDLKLKKDWVPIEKISPHLQLAVVASEDQNFLKHYGFDFKAIEKAMKHNNKKGRKTMRGASTISQQTAKNVFLWPQRSWIRKAFEVYFTFLIELCWSKERILEVYLNVIEMGDGIYGSEAASNIYFKKSAEKLTKEEAALIAAILPNPRKYSAVKPSPYIRGRQQWILKQMRNFGGKLDFEKNS